MNRKFKITYKIGDSFLSREIPANNIWDALHQFRDSFPEVHITEILEI